VCDEEVYKYIHALTKINDMSCSAHVALACLLSALHKKMLEWLKRKHEDGLAWHALLAYWQGLMEGESREHRERFFSEVVQLANSVSHPCHVFHL
jgi:hypothetical protein